MLVKEIYTPDAVCCSGQTRVLEAAQIMRQRHVGDLVVVDDPDDERVPLGLVTDRDIVVDVLGNGLDAATTTLASVMHKPAVIANEGEDTGQVLERMRINGVRRIPVVDARGSLVGIVTLDDLLGVVVEEATALLQVVARGQKREARGRR